MNVDDIIYIFLLLGCIGFGYVYRNYLDSENVSRKRLIGSLVGLSIVIVVSGLHVIHVLFGFAVSAFIILMFDVQKAHLLTFGFNFGYLLFFRMTEYFGIPAPPGHTNLIQMMMTLKMVGLAFERNTAAKEQAENKSTDAIAAIKKAYYTDILDLNLEDMSHYCFNYIGVLTGPYYSYRTFRDYFTAGYWQHVNCERVLFNRLKWVVVYAALFLTCSYYWPIHYALSDEFYFDRSFLYRLWYVWPSFFNFRMRIYIGLTLSECVCICAGFGAYPTAFRSRPGGGPKDIVALDKPVAESHFDFETIHNVDAETTERCWTFREAMRSYNMCIQYWMASVVYQRFPNKKFRTLATLGVSAFWHGIHSGYYMCMMGAPMYLPIETLWDKLIREKAQGMRRRIIDVVFWVSKFFAFSYLGMAFLLMTIDKIWYYYKSVYHIGYLIWLGMFGVGMLLLQQQKKEGAAGKKTK